MTNNSLFEYNRQEALKKWEPIPNMYSEPELIQYFNHKVKIDDVDIQNRPDEPFGGFFNSLKETDVYFKYLKHIVLMHMSYIIKYIENKGIVLGDIRWNIRQILNEIINNEVDEDYYLNTINIYESIAGFDEGEADVYDLLDQAIKRGNWRMVYYLIFWEDETMSDRLCEVTKR